MASRSYPEEDFRRRPGRSKTGNTSRIDEEEENRSTEVAEEQADDLDDDPLVLKGSRPMGPQKKLPQGAVSVYTCSIETINIQRHIS